MDIIETPPQAALLVVGSSAVFSFNQAVITIGRNSDNDLVIESSKVSREHARLRFNKGDFDILDLESTGGTYVNGQKIEKCILFEGDVITLANVHLVFGSKDFPVAESTTKYKYPERSNKKSQDTTQLVYKGTAPLE